MARSTHVAIIGGGFSGAVTAIELVRSAPCGQVKITIVNPTPQIGRGLAYRFHDDNLLLNVPAGNMSALADEPGHFVAYGQRIDPALQPDSFVPRGLYGRYLQDLWAQTQGAYPGAIEMVVDEAMALSRASSPPGWSLTLASGQSLSADQVVLATGHQTPRFPVPIDPDARTCVIDPWNFAAMRQLPDDQPVVIVGTGHTAADALFCLAQSSTRRPVYLVSRHGMLPHRHRLSPSPPKPQALPDYLCGVPATVRAYTRALRQHLKTRSLAGTDWRDAFNELRPHTPRLWQSLPVAEQRRFLRHLQAHWDVHRHRLAPIAAGRLDELIANGQAKALAGRIVSVQKQAHGVTVTWRPRGAQQVASLQASAVINCVGPSTDVKRHATPLLAQLLLAGLIHPDPHGLGLTVAPDCQVLDSRLQAVQNLWYVGPLLKGTLWEATAVPELRVHARQLAVTLLAQMKTTLAEALP